MNNDAAGYRRYLEGDDSGLAEIIEMYDKRLSLYINSIVKDICLAEEIMQETFVKLAVKKPKFSGNSSFATWLFTIARNCALDHLRKNSRFTELPETEGFLMSDEEDIEKELIKEEQKSALHKAMKKLPPDYSQVLYLKYFEELGNSDIAAVMHKSARQTGDLVYRAKNALKTELERSGFEYEDI